jgi:hypothetical protein
MRFDQRCRHLHRILQRLVQPQPVPGNQAVERLALHVLHGEEVDALGLIDVVNGDDVGVIQRRGCPSFLNEPPLAVGISHWRWAISCEASGSCFRADHMLIESEHSMAREDREAPGVEMGLILISPVWLGEVVPGMQE